MDTMTMPPQTETENRIGRTSGHSTIHTAGANTTWDASFDLSNVYEPVLAQPQPEPVAAFETQPSPGPSKNATRAVVGLGVAIVLVGAAAAVTNVLDLFQGPVAHTTTTVADTGGADPVVDDAAVAPSDDAAALPADDEAAASAEPVMIEQRSATVTSGARIRSGPATAAGPVGVVEGGQIVEITGEPQNGWYPISYQGISGWTWGALLSDFQTTLVPSPDGAVVEATPEGEAPVAPDAATDSALPTVMVALRSLNLRTGPGTNTPSQLVIPAGAVVETTSDAQSGWVPITFNGQAGYVRVENLRPAN